MADPTVRTLRLLSLLAARPTWSGPGLAERLGTTERTVRRDVDRLRAAGYPVDSAPGTTGGYRLAPGAALPPLVLGDDEAVALAVCLRAGANGTVRGVEDAAQEALAKLEQVLPARLRPRVGALAAMTVAITPEGGPVDPQTLATLAHACRESLRTRFAYADRDGNPSDRRVEPHRLVHTGRRWYLAAWDLDRDDWRTFRLDRISEAATTGHRFTFEDPPDAGRLVSEAISTRPYRWQTRVVLDADRDRVAALVPASVATLTARDDGTTELASGADHLDHLALHLASLDIAFTVIEPDELRTRLAELATQLTSAASA